MSRLQKILLKAGITLNNYSYSLISRQVSKIHHGVHPKHQIINYHEFFVGQISKKDRVLDVGCGNGFLAYDVAKKAKKVTDIDFSKENISFAQTHYSLPNLDFVVGDATTYPFKDKFEVIILSNVLEHIKERPALLNKLKKIAPKIIIRVPLITRSWLPVYLKKEGYEYRLDDTHEIEYTEEEIAEEMKKAGLKIKKEFVKWGEWYGVCTS